MKKVVVYTREGCPHSTRLVKELKEEGVNFELIDLTYDQEEIQKVKEKYGADRVPVLVEGEKVTIGYRGGMG